MEPLTIELTRAGTVEAVHRVHVVVVDGERPVLTAGDADRWTFFRSSSKPIQALPVVRAVPDLDDEEVALCCASHLARPEQITVVRRLLARAGVSDDDLECGPEPTRIEHNCSGKHAGFLALCRARGWDTSGYRLPGHPCQQAMHEEVAEATGIAPDALPTAADGCGVVTFGVTLTAAARAFVRVRAHPGADRVVSAMRMHPELLRGSISADAAAMRILGDGWIGKGGAEGLYCAGGPTGIGVALKAEDGSPRALRPALAHVLERIGVPCDGLHDPVVRNSRGEEVGVLRVRESPGNRPGAGGS